MPAALIAALPAAMRSTQKTFDRTGGLHAAALFDDEGRLVVVREDVGRHNAVDKVLGYALLNGLLPLSRHVLLVSGRSSFEIMQKVLAGRIPIVAAVSAPSSLAVDFARENNQTLIGFLREKRMNVYCGHERILYEQASPPVNNPAGRRKGTVMDHAIRKKCFSRTGRRKPADRPERPSGTRSRGGRTASRRQRGPRRAPA